MNSDPGRQPNVLVLTPVYNETAGLPAYEDAVRQTLLSRTDCRVRVLFIEDGSSDDSWRQICDIASRDARFRGIRLSRNYGSHIALSAGFANIGDADAVATLACDLQDPPEVVSQFIDTWKGGVDIVWGRRITRDESAAKVWTSRLFESLIRRHAMPRGSRFTTGSFLLVDRKVAECFARFQEHNRVTFALVAWTGFSEAVVDYHRQRPALRRLGMDLRPHGEDHVRHVHRILADADPDHDDHRHPLVSLLTIPLAAYFLAVWIGGRPLPGWTSVMLALTVFFGLQFLMMGVVGEYLYRIYAEVVRRPLYFVSATTEARAPAIHGR